MTFWAAWWDGGPDLGIHVKDDSVHTAPLYNFFFCKGCPCHLFHGFLDNDISSKKIKQMNKQPIPHAHSKPNQVESHDTWEAVDGLALGQEWARVKPSLFSQIIIRRNRFYVGKGWSREKRNGAESCQQNGTSLTCVLLGKASKRIFDNRAGVKTVVRCGQHRFWTQYKRQTI